jgi:hypothetical protein
VSVPGKRTGVIGLAGSVGGVGAPVSGVAGCGVAAGSFTGPLHAAANAPAKSRLDQRTSLGMVLSASKRQARGEILLTGGAAFDRKTGAPARPSHDKTKAERMLDRPAVAE